VKMDILFEFMKKHDIAMTRENYLDVMFLGTPPEVLDAEIEVELPEEFRIGWPNDRQEIE
jgi:hypothetical protein